MRNLIFQNAVYIIATKTNNRRLKIWEATNYVKGFHIIPTWAFLVISTK